VRSNRIRTYQIELRPVCRGDAAGQHLPAPGDPGARICRSASEKKYPLYPRTAEYLIVNYDQAGTGRREPQEKMERRAAKRLNKSRPEAPEKAAARSDEKNHD
jgi:hypothetical protein